MKKYLFPLILFFCTYLLGVLLHEQIKIHFIKEITTTILKLTLGIAFYVYTIKFIKNQKSLFKFSRIKRNEVQFIIFLVIIFIINNYFHSTYSNNIEYMKSQVIGLTILNYIINSFFEEFAYRGFIQNYVNQSIEKRRTPISQGNLFASILMIIPHLGFFTVMDTTFAITGLILVFIYSLTAGYLRDNGMSIWTLIIIHTLINFIHLIINIEHYV
jgi:membrane protease YdiL (CAAX protease family)|tara:strand:+ start:184 stop:828 length:645 start_codon:yes stop_codon:yes gene_type:complete